MSDDLSEFQTDGARYDGDILKLSAAEFHALPKLMQRSIYFKTIDVSGLSSLPALKRRIAEFIHCRSCDSSAVPLGDLNRRYGRAAKSFGTQTTPIVHSLVASEHITEIPIEGKTVLYSTPIYKEQLALIESEGGTAYTLVERLKTKFVTAGYGIDRL